MLSFSVVWMCRVCHLQVLGIVDEVDSDGTPFFGIVMPLMQGSLRDAIDGSLRGAFGVDAPLPPMRQRLLWIADIAGALAFGHAEGIVHGDLKVGTEFKTATAADISVQLVHDLPFRRQIFYLITKASTSATGALPGSSTWR